MLKKFKEIDNSFVDEEFNEAFAGVDKEDIKFNLNLKKSKKENEEKLDDFVFDSKWKTEYEEEMERIKRDYEITKRENDRKMEKLKVRSLMSKLIHEKEMKKLEKVESKIKEQTYEELKKLRIENDKKVEDLKKEGELARQEQKYFGQVDLENEKQRYENKINIANKSKTGKYGCIININ